MNIFMDILAYANDELEENHAVSVFSSKIGSHLDNLLQDDKNTNMIIKLGNIDSLEEITHEELEFINKYLSDFMKIYRESEVFNSFMEILSNYDYGIPKEKINQLIKSLNVLVKEKVPNLNVLDDIKKKEIENAIQLLIKYTNDYNEDIAVKSYGFDEQGRPYIEWVNTKVSSTVYFDDMDIKLKAI